MLRLQVWLACVRESLEQIAWKYRLEAVTMIGANLAAAASALLYTGSEVCLHGSNRTVQVAVILLGNRV